MSAAAKEIANDAQNGTKNHNHDENQYLLLIQRIIETGEFFYIHIYTFV